MNALAIKLPVGEGGFAFSEVLVRVRLFQNQVSLTMHRAMRFRKNLKNLGRLEALHSQTRET